MGGGTVGSSAKESEGGAPMREGGRPAAQHPAGHDRREGEPVGPVQDPGHAARGGPKCRIFFWPGTVPSSNRCPRRSPQNGSQITFWGVFVSEMLQGWWCAIQKRETALTPWPHRRRERSTCDVPKWCFAASAEKVSIPNVGALPLASPPLQLFGSPK